MKIKKINEDKVQIIITNQDLEERDFKKWELMPLSPKAQELFQDLLDMAYQECGFEIEDDSQLMVEAYPLSVDSFAIVMTKVHSSHHNNEQVNIFSPFQNEGEEETEDFRSLRGAEQVWAFQTLEDCGLACSRVEPDLVENSALFKYEGEYYLALTSLPEAQTELMAIMGEYGEWVYVDRVFLVEYGTCLIRQEALVNMASLIRPPRQ